MKSQRNFQRRLTRPVGRPILREMTPKPIGRLIRYWRVEKLGWSLARLQDESGVLNQTINAIEIGVSQNPQLKTIKPITDALGIPWPDVVTSIAEDAKTFADSPHRRTAARAS